MATYDGQADSLNSFSNFQLDCSLLEDEELMYEARLRKVPNNDADLRTERFMRELQQHCDSVQANLLAFTLGAHESEKKRVQVNTSKLPTTITNLKGTLEPNNIPDAISRMTNRTAHYYFRLGRIELEDDVESTERRAKLQKRLIGAATDIRNPNYFLKMAVQSSIEPPSFQEPSQFLDQNRQSVLQTSNVLNSVDNRSTFPSMEPNVRLDQTGTIPRRQVSMTTSDLNSYDQFQNELTYRSRQEDENIRTHEQFAQIRRETQSLRNDLRLMREMFQNNSLNSANPPIAAPRRISCKAMGPRNLDLKDSSELYPNRVPYPGHEYMSERERAEHRRGITSSIIGCSTSMDLIRE